MEKETAEKVQKSISEIYTEILKNRREAKEQKKEEKERQKQEETGEHQDQNRPMTKKEKAAARFESWKEVLVGLTGDDLDYISPKKKRKKYRKWIGDETENRIDVEKAKKKKKRNYNKEFEPELNMLKAIINDQNKFVQDLQKRYQTNAGPNTRDSGTMNKTLVELAAVVNNARGNSLGILREIGNIKKTIADLYMKQRKLDADLGGLNIEEKDLGLMGSSLAANMFEQMGTPVGPPTATGVNGMIQVQPPSETGPPISDFDPDSWSVGDDSTKYENMDKKIVVEWHKNTNQARYKAVDNQTGMELQGCPVPTGSIKSIDPINKVAKDDFDQVYQIEIVE
jgi:hypothetical protein